jgi:two-component system nitrogen regulation response regulator GlnG
MGHFLRQAGTELEVEPKILRSDAEVYLSRLDWPGNVRQLENLCRWLTVMASGREIHVGDLPPDLRECPGAQPGTVHWVDALGLWATQALAEGERHILDTAVPAFERTLIRVALEHSRGHRQEAAKLLGWGRNTLTRKIKELAMD